MGRHVSSERRRSLRGRFFLALLAIIVLIGVAAFAAYQIWDRSGDRPAPRRTPATATSTSTSTSTATATATASPARSATPATPVTLALTVTGAKCLVFVRVPGGDILVNRDLLRGQSVRFDEPRLSIVLGDSSAASVYVNGKLRPPGKSGRVAFTALKG